MNPNLFDDARADRSEYEAVRSIRALVPFVCPLILLVLCTPPGLRAQVVPVVPRHVEPYSVDSGLFDGPDEGETIAFQHVVASPGAPWLRLHIADHYLGAGSYLTFTSLTDGASQPLDARMIEHWFNASAIFFGDSVLVELHVAGGDRGVFFRIEEILVGEEATGEDGIASICGASDNRTASSDGRSGRLFFGGCSAWLASNGTVLSAGHCVDFDPDDTPAGCGPQLPDGILDLTGVFEANVPTSFANGTTRPAAPEDQYPINLNSVVWNFDGGCQGLGKDFSVFTVGPNANTGLRAHMAEGFFRMTREAPAINNTIRVTGHGSDAGTANFTNQTHTGPYQGEVFQNATDISHTYQVDTTGGNSGSPVIWNTNGVAIGIHTNAGCNADGSGANSGTSFEHNPLEAALDNFYDADTVHVDGGMPALGPAENGTVFRPYNTVLEGVTAVPTGGIVIIVEGSYPGETMTINRAMTLMAPVGTVTIGN